MPPVAHRHRQDITPMRLPLCWPQPTPLGFGQSQVVGGGTRPEFSWLTLGRGRHMDFLPPSRRLNSSGQAFPEQGPAQKFVKAAGDLRKAHTEEQLQRGEHTKIASALCSLERATTSSGIEVCVLNKFRGRCQGYSGDLRPPHGRWDQQPSTGVDTIDTVNAATAWMAMPPA